MTTWIAAALLAFASAQAQPAQPAKPAIATSEGAKAVESLRAALAAPALKGVDLSKGEALAALANASFAQVALSKTECEQARAVLWEAYANSARAACQAELDSGAITVNGVTMKIASKTFGTAPAGRGRNLWISMHGGGGAPAEVNDKQWQNQQRLYTPDEGIYVAPRAPTDTWDLWHQGHIDALYARLIQDMVIAQGVDANRVYLMGYSAGGDGVYQLAPRMADELAAAAMMAGHPNESKPDGLRNIGFTLHVGEKDDGFNRNRVAAEWGLRLEELQKEDPNGYPHWVKVHKGKGHWMDREDAEALKWMERFTRNMRPRRVVWLQDDVTHKRFYWLAVEAPVAGERIDAIREGQKITFTQCTASSPVHLRLDDQMCDLDKQISVAAADSILFEGIPKRTIGMLIRTLAERGDPDGMFPAELVLPQTAPKPQIR